MDNDNNYSSGPENDADHGFIDSGSIYISRNAPSHLEKKDIMKMRERTHMLEPVIRIGKNGINDNVITEITTLLKKRRLIKIKVLKNSLENNEFDALIEEVVRKSSSTLISKIGLTFCLYK